MIFDMETIENVLRNKWGVEDVKPFGSIGGGDICEGQGYEISNGERIYVKTASNCSLKKTEDMFKGEYESLKAINISNTVKVPKPLFVWGKSALVTEYLDIKSLSSKHSATFGHELARQMSHPFMEKVLLRNHLAISQFGFHIPTCCGRIPQPNQWMDNWIEFFCQQKLQPQLHLIESSYGDREALQLWSELQLKISKYFQGLSITPSLIHGDLWSGNVGETQDKPVVFDPSCFYGHSEFEFGIATIFPSRAFNGSFYTSYHKLVPKSKGFNERQKLYQLFHYLNHWNHFGHGYRGSCISIMKDLVSD
ncbi:Ketosamine-3-kinase [Nymphon striatum]|nr:Ketosamine-3-kinase [Nymphon striatum]